MPENTDPTKKGLSHFEDNNPGKANQLLDKYAGDNNYRLKTLTISSPSGGEVDITTIFVGMSIYEDMFSNTMSCSVSFHDTNDICRHLPIVGQREKIKAVFSLPGDKDIEYTFDIYRISVKNISTVGKKQAITLQGVSAEQFKNIHTKVSRSFYDSIDNIIETIYNDYLKPDGSASQYKLSTILPTNKEKRKFIIPNWHPFDAINWLLTRATPKDNDNASNYIFFQNRDGHHLTTIEDLFKIGSKPRMEYFYMPRRYREAPANFRDPGYEMRNIQRLIFEEPGNRLDENVKGMYGSSILTHDIVRKKYKLKKFQLKSNFSKTKHIEQNYPIAQGIDKFSKEYNTFFNFCPIHKNLNQKNKLHGGDTIEQNEKYAEWLLNRKSLIRQIGANIININVSGDSRRSPGDVVHLTHTPLQPAVGKDLKYNKYINGKYLVTSVQHNLTPDGYWMNMELSKDSMEEVYSSSSNFLEAMENINGPVVNQ